MKSLFDTAAVKEIEQRINTLTPESQRQWGKMNVAQMLAHCNEALEVAAGKKFPPRIFIGRLIGGFARSGFFGDKPYPKSSPTDKSYIMKGKHDFQTEKERLLNTIREFYSGGKEKCTTHPHSFFGKLNPDEWSMAMYKHLDHHLRQFGA